ncbi:cell division protein FtsZ [Guyparkeria sp. SB14A]|uniref:cell division protein FtsZ n=1 Tax=Guyparkeria sp. SB14A TaxID=2571147 RepID=UPI001FFCF0A0|nr:cell division protein FtsZ [Guyparkeria sp. SB14A]
MSNWTMAEMQTESAKIKVIGVGGGGGNAVAHMVMQHIEGIEYISANTDAQALVKSNAPSQLQIGANITKGLGAGADPELGRQAALEDREQIQEAISDANMLFITTGMGGGTGTGAAPVIAQIARDMNILTVAVVTRPFSFEGKKRTAVAMEGIQELEDNVDSLIVIPNDQLTAVMGKQAALRDAFAAANEVLFTAVAGISELITRPGEINLDFADVRAIMTEKGTAMMGTGIGTGDNRAAEAAEAAIHSPLLDDINLTGAEGILVNVTSNGDLSIGEFMEIGEMVQGLAGDEAVVKVGTAVDDELDGQLRVTLVATGLSRIKNVNAESSKPRVVIDNARREEATESSEQPRAEAQQAYAGTAHRGNTAINLDTIDIPSFLRHQAD